ncbi:MAG: hypothetical protein WA477_02625 [Candidatus Sulfotelmatobacter sp.]
MRKRELMVALLLFMIAASGGARTACAQEESKESAASRTAKVEDSVDAYRLDVSFNELEDGKKLNTRHYSIDLTGGRPEDIKIGSRVPVVSANCGSSSASSPSGGSSEQYQYLDLGTHLMAQLISHGDLHVSGDISSLDTSAGTETTTRLGPVIRQIRIEGSTALVLGKPILIGSADDPNSRRQFELEVTVTKLR